MFWTLCFISLEACVDMLEEENKNNLKIKNIFYYISLYFVSVFSDLFGTANTPYNTV